MAFFDRAIVPSIRLQKRPDGPISLSRRNFIRTAGLGMTLLGVSSRESCAAPADVGDEGYDFLMARVRFKNRDKNWNVFPGGDRNLLSRFGQVVRCRVKDDMNCRNERPDNGSEEHFNAVVDLDSLEDLERYPFAFMTGSGGFSLPEKQNRNLMEYIQRGGFILMDDCTSPRRADDFFLSSCRELECAFGSGSLVEIPKNHEIFSNVYDFTSTGLPRWKRSRRVAEIPEAMGVFIGDRLAAFVSVADLHCGWTDPFDRWRKRAGHEDSIKMGINILTYAMSH